MQTFYLEAILLSLVAAVLDSFYAKYISVLHFRVVYPSRRRCEGLQRGEDHGFHMK